MPTYVANGNHDGEVQGFVSATQSANAVATGCFKPYINSPTQTAPAYSVFARARASPCRPTRAGGSSDRAELKGIYAAGSQRDAHGFGFVDPAQNGASGGSASYYAWTPKPGLRFVSLDTVSEGTGRPRVAPRATWTTPSTSGCAASCGGPRRRGSSWWSSATTRSGA